MRSNKIKNNIEHAELSLLKGFSQESPIFEVNSEVKLVSIFGFNIQRFYSRYLCGYESLRTGRNVSRKRIALAKVIHDLNVIPNDPEALLLAFQIEQFEKSKSYLKSSEIITKDVLCKVNKMLASEKSNTGSIRKSQNFIGKSLSKAKYVPPSPEKLNDLLEDLVNFINKKALSINDILAIHCQLIAVHPFADGNGRLARVLFEALLESFYPLTLPNPWLYRLHCSDGRFQRSIVELGEKNTFNENTIAFWNEAFGYSEKIKQECNFILTKSLEEFNKKFSSLDLSSNISQELLNYLWNQPIVTENYLVKVFKLQKKELSNLITVFVKEGVIVPRKVRYPFGTVIYDSPFIFGVWAKLDQLITKEI